MLEKLTPQPPDKIIAMIAEFRKDPRTDKVDLGVGVYKDAAGKTPVMRAVKRAEQKLWESQESKSYTALLGDSAFTDVMRDLVLGDAVDTSRVVGAAAPGGTGALHLLFEMVQAANPEATVWMSDPTWPNHPAILNHLGIPNRTYRYFDNATRAVDFDGMMADLEAASSGDVLLLHGCCHNPTGANLSLEQWGKITDFVLSRNLLPLVDFAYQGFGDGLDSDAAAVRSMAVRVPELLIGASCSKNFGLYRDRVGAAIVVGQSSETASIVRENLASLNRLNFSFPPDHGAAVVTLIMTDPALRAEWQNELEEMRLRMLDLRTSLADALRREANDNRFDFLAHHRGMFSRLGASPEQIKELRDDHGYYIVGDSRINVAGLQKEGLEKMARAMIAAGL